MAAAGLLLKKDLSPRGPEDLMGEGSIRGSNQVWARDKKYFFSRLLRSDPPSSRVEATGTGNNFVQRMNKKRREIDYLGSRLSMINKKHGHAISLGIRKIVGSNPVWFQMFEFGSR